MALTFVIATAGAPASNPFAHEFLGLLSSARDVL